MNGDGEMKVQELKDKDRLLEFIEEISDDLRDSDEELVEVLEAVSILVKKNKSALLSLYDTTEAVEFLIEWSQQMENDEPELSHDLGIVAKEVKNQNEE